ncbi:MBL fold metallo-hydrolase [Granulosicoccus antarcticus]|uniref:Hydroxyacylglutathione hydrolase n=1 Tax=Granulosicoccus antarcticus IMCC3135 TaxID=1192854 RepID=A0A2Z2NZ24_9GAMM|nr:MBL fold metallo-hydrolase [Granulosicoccus antarcticus]ASJ72384.1 Hydroxyacylglutathione hydrolase [Granulosicoccus antarcticus IMCC3135]
MSVPDISPTSPDYLFDSVPAPAEIRSVCEGIQWIRLPLPFALDHVNCWLLGEPGEQVLVDTGVATSKSRALWQQHWGAKGADGLASVPEKLLVTHFHPDHAGLAGWFGEAGSQLYGSAVEIALSRSIWSRDDSEYAQEYARWYAENGIPEEAISQVLQKPNSYRLIVSEPPAAELWTCLEAGQVVELGGAQYRVLVGRGHAPDMLMLYRESDHVLIAADQILPRISPNVSVSTVLADQNPLQSFLDTLDELKVLPEDTLVLPSHGIPFRGLHARIGALQAHHEDRLAEVYQACRQPASAYDMFSVLFARKLDAQQMSFALGESLAHLHFLEHQGSLTRQSCDGVDQFVQVEQETKLDK